MFCTRCGSSLAADAAFCSKCGAPTGSGAPAESPGIAPPPASIEESLPRGARPELLRRVSWIVAAIGAVVGVVTVITEPPGEATSQSTRILIWLYAVVVSSYVCWAWYWGILRVYGSRATLFFKPMRAVTVDLWRSAGANDPIGCVRIFFLPIIGILAYMTFVVLIAVLAWGAVLYGFFGGAIFEYQRTYRNPTAGRSTPQELSE